MVQDTSELFGQFSLIKDQSAVQNLGWGMLVSLPYEHDYDNDVLFGGILFEEKTGHHYFHGQLIQERSAGSPISANWYWLSLGDCFSLFTKVEEIDITEDEDGTGWLTMMLIRNGLFTQIEEEDLFPMRVGLASWLEARGIV